MVEDLLERKVQPRAKEEEEEEDEEDDEHIEDSSHCKSISSIRELLIEKSFSQEDEEAADRTESDNENIRSVKSQGEDTINNSHKEDILFTNNNINNNYSQDNNKGKGQHNNQLGLSPFAGSQVAPPHLYLSKLNANYYQKKKQMHQSQKQQEQQEAQLLANCINKDNKNIKQKNGPSIKMGSSEWIQNYRLQERERYNHPQK